MPGMRVHDLAKEFGLSNKEMLDKLKEMGIAAKTHATPLSDENVKAVRAVFAPAETEAAEKGETAPTPSQVAAKEAAAKRAEEEAANLAAVKAERAKREIGERRDGR